MAMTERDVEDFLRALQNSAELRERVRSVLLADDFLALPGLMRANTEAIAALTERMVATERRLHGVEERLELLEFRLHKVEGHVGNLTGSAFEERFVRNMRSNLGPRFRRPRPLDVYADDIIETFMAQRPLSGKQLKDVATADLVVWANDTEVGREVVLVIEVSQRIGLGDVTRAHRRAALLSGIGVPAVAITAGSSISTETAAAARQNSVVVIVQQPEEDEPAA
jgi:hypothetical protein